MLKTGAGENFANPGAEKQHDPNTFCRHDRSKLRGIINACDDDG